MSASVSIATPHLPTSPIAQRVVGVAAHQRRQVERGRQAVAAGGEELLEPLRWCRSAVPKPANIRIVQSFERYIDAYGPAGVRVLARELAVVGPVDGLERDPRHRPEVRLPEARGLVLPLPPVPSRHVSHYRPQ